ncbi:hypothetical protein [Methylobacterium nodulans]|uniref:Uncharacterized protein n=1 Tax=Methylobacterium nodulans (strain LMG 21967 / CNCM I-2342 / ORS 2060) TaxID=460265 RepID=B8IIX2_METNO|nr:hypothetical protein [Methylobacterium nodulans]ACL61767.1 hypothetical protein Mnod_7026 [Methylobacterium nodulans ORS 2060]
MILGPDLTTLKEAAKKRAQSYFVSIAESDGVEPTLRAMYVLKLQEARRVLAGGASDMIHEEAQIRGISDLEMAQMIDAMAADSTRLEMARMQTNVAIDAATSEAGVLAILARFGLTLSLDAGAA